MFIISQSDNKNLGTVYYEIPRLILNKSELSRDIYLVYNRLSINFLKINKRCKRIPENTISNVINNFYHKSPVYDESEINRITYLIEINKL